MRSSIELRMRELVVYFNELSAPPTDMAEALSADWRTCALMLLACLRQVHRYQGRLRIAFPIGYWHEPYGGKPLSAWVAKWLGKSEYLWVLGRLRTVNSLGAQDAEVYFNERKGIGITMSHLAGSWAFSFPVTNSDWLTSSLSASEYRLADQEVTMRTCTVKHLATDVHARGWETDLRDWGQEVAEDNTISIHGGYRIAMYPLDHGYPHVHLVDPRLATGRSTTIAKYRVDRFERMEGRPCWDSHMRMWVAAHREHLLASWDRCQRGGHPFRITEEET